MEKTRTYNLVILDASGSMCSIKRQAIDGFNEHPQSNGVPINPTGHKSNVRHGEL